MNVVAPHINLNGSSAETLIKDIIVARDAMRLAIDLVAQTAPHPRDWQTVKDADALYGHAIAQHRDRLNHLHRINEELEAIGVAIQDQIEARAKR
jgi:hypothetical protein